MQVRPHPLHQARATPHRMQQLLLLRDIVLVLLMWETSMQGNNCGKLTCSDVFLPGGQPAPFPLCKPVARGTSLVLKPDGTKTAKGERSGPFTLIATEDSQHSCLVRLIQYLQHRYPAGQIQHRYLFSPLTSTQQGFADAPPTASALGKRLNKHLQDAGLYAGESKGEVKFRAWWHVG